MIIASEFKVGDLVRINKSVDTFNGKIPEGSLGVVTKIVPKTIKIGAQDESWHWIYVHLTTGEIRGFYNSWLSKVIKDV